MLPLGPAQDTTAGADKCVWSIHGLNSRPSDIQTSSGNSSLWPRRGPAMHCDFSVLRSEGADGWVLNMSFITRHLGSLLVARTERTCSFLPARAHNTFSA